MINFKKLSREELKNVLGGQGCSIAVQESNKS
ncbi:bacteriocin [Flavobacterium rhamnosiphilum]|uniref:Bacteriocin n=2 Tax=Flavobacterium TaxID=237 RepID=A0A4R5FAI2_9FLAO|nr:bacteriocin [Flavobacterium rhamnosiphilum]